MAEKSTKEKTIESKQTSAPISQTVDIAAWRNRKLAVINRRTGRKAQYLASSVIANSKAVK